MPAAGGSAAALAAVWPRPAPGEAVLLPRSDRAAPTLPDALAAKGYRVDAVVAYRTGRCRPPEDVAADLRDRSIGAVLLTSPSTVTALRGMRDRGRSCCGAIGAPDRGRSAAAGLRLAFVADRPTARGWSTG